jgi:hypothetical protein
MVPGQQQEAARAGAHGEQAAAEHGGRHRAAQEPVPRPPAPGVA